MINKETITDLFFDLDHTLWDFEKNSALTFDQLLIDYQIPVRLDDFLKVYVPLNLEYWKAFREQRMDKETLRYRRIKDTFDQLKISIDDDMVYTLADAYIQNLPEHNHLFPGAIEVLDKLKERYSLHIITNGFREVQYFKMRNAGLTPYFSTVTDSESVGVKKPNPLIFQKALTDANCDPTRSVMIGDSYEADILGALQVGMHAIHFAIAGENPHNDCVMIDDLGRLLEIL
ncbi:MAG: YjjG family noncanonical pyrimidine nucleotidase [Flavobacteriaceae bacterium]